MQCKMYARDGIVLFTNDDKRPFSLPLALYYLQTPFLVAPDNDHGDLSAFSRRCMFTGFVHLQICLICGNGENHREILDSDWIENPRSYM